MQSDSTVFVVDDDPAALDSLCWFLKSHRLKTEAYSSAREYLDAYDPDKPGCLVLDVRMPEMCGLELQEKLIFWGERLPIIFVSGHGSISTSVRAMKAGALDFLEKPTDNEAILRAVRRAMERDYQRRRRQEAHTSIEAGIERLSRREAEVMELLYAGKSMKKIARELGITVQTVAKHRSRILQKLNVETDAELVRLLAERRLQHP